MKSDMENKDWLNDYSSLKQINPANPFTVPVGYFDDLENRIVSHKNFDELTDNGPTAGFIVPDNYFEELSGNIQSRLTIEEIIDPDDMGFTIPEGYFDNLEQQIKSRIFIEEALGEPADDFAVPEGYFDTLSKNILNKTVNADSIKESVKRRGIVRKLYSSTMFKYATAACFAVALGGGILLRSLSGNSVTDHRKTFLHEQLSTVPLDDIKSYLQLNEDAGDTQQTVATESLPVDDTNLKNALQDDADSVQ